MPGAFTISPQKLAEPSRRNNSSSRELAAANSPIAARAAGGRSVSSSWAAKCFLEVMLGGLGFPPASSPGDSGHVLGLETKLRGAASSQRTQCGAGSGYV